MFTYILLVLAVSVLPLLLIPVVALLIDFWRRTRASQVQLSSSAPRIPTGCAKRADVLPGHCTPEFPLS